METEEPEEVNPIFLNLFSPDELIKILQWLLMNKVPEELDINSMSKEELLQTIGDEIHILSYCIEQWSQEIQEKISPIEVNDVLVQLGLDCHYLNSKAVAFWDEYDYANYSALREKAGRPAPMYGIFDSDVSEEDKYIVTTPPAKLYETYEEALTEMNHLIIERNFKKEELKIMSL